MKLEEHFKAILEGLDHDTSTEGLRDTPKRYIKFLGEFCKPKRFRFTTFSSGGFDEMIKEENLTFASLCAHHVLPFFGHGVIAYIPNKRIAGLSKLARTLDHFSASLQTQENLTQQVADFLESKLQPKGVGVLLKAEHTCMTIRGVRKPGALTSTACFKGVFKTDPATRAEFMAQLPSAKA